MTPRDLTTLDRKRWRTWVAVALGGAAMLSVVLFLVLRRSDKGQERAHRAQDTGSMAGMDMGTPIPGHAEVSVAPEIQQRIGVTTAKVENQALETTIRTVGIVRANETKLAEVHLKTEGWVEKLYVSYTGQLVKRGDPLLAIYSRNFLNTQLDYIIARRAAAAARDDGLAASEHSLLEASLKRLALLDVPPDQIAELVRTQQARKTLILRSEVDGTVIEKKAFLRQYVTPNEALYTIADLSTVWVEGKIYEQELAHVTIGQAAVVTIPAQPTRKFDAQVAFVDPVVEETARTVQVRVELPNREGLFRPGMFANVELAHQIGEALVVPASAIIRTGERNIAYRVEADNRFVPVEVALESGQFGEQLHVISGLQAGDVVITSANFLIDSESRLRAGGGNMAGMDMPGMEKGKASGDMKNMPMNGNTKNTPQATHTEGGPTSP